FSRDWSSDVCSSDLAAWREARTLIWSYRSRLAVGLALMLVNRLAGFVLPASSKYLIDNVLGQGQADLLVPLAAAAGVATLVQARSAERRVGKERGSR